MASFSLERPEGTIAITTWRRGDSATQWRARWASSEPTGWDGAWFWTPPEFDNTQVAEIACALMGVLAPQKDPGDPTVVFEWHPHGELPWWVRCTVCGPLGETDSPAVMGDAHILAHEEGTLPGGPGPGIRWSRDGFDPADPGCRTEFTSEMQDLIGQFDRYGLVEDAADSEYLATIAARALDIIDTVTRERDDARAMFRDAMSYLDVVDDTGGRSPLWERAEAELARWDEPEAP